jgi:lia operon protein LiaG
MTLCSPRNRLFLATGLLVAIAGASPAQTERRALSGDRVAIYNLAGRLRVQAGTGAQVTVDVTRAGRDAGQLKIATGEAQGSQSLRVVYPSDRVVYPDMRSRSRTQLRVNGDGTFDDRDGGRDWFGRDRVEIRDSGGGLEAHADLVVSVPKGQKLAIHWGVGDATVSNVDGDIRLSVAAATVNTEHTRGRLDLDTGSGAVTVTDAEGEVILDSGSGGVTVNGVRGDHLDMDTGSGRIRADDVDVKSFKADVGSGGLTMGRLKASRVNVDVGSGGLSLDLISVVEDLTIDAGSGGVTVRLPAAQGAEIEIETGSGGIESDFAVQANHVERNHVRGQIGDGRGRIKIESGSGRVRLIKT